MEVQTPIRKLNKSYNELVKFLFDYAQNHTYISKKMTSGLYINIANPMHDRADVKKFQTHIKRKISLILNILAKKGISERYGQNTYKILPNKLKDFTLKDILSFTIKN